MTNYDWNKGLIVSVYENGNLIFSGCTGPVNDAEADLVEDFYSALYPNAIVQVQENDVNAEVTLYCSQYTNESGTYFSVQPL